MDRDGPIYGYSLADRISARTEGAWRPGAGAIYPALQALVARRLAQVDAEGRRRIYRITPTGRAFLRRLRRGWLSMGVGGPDLGLLWSEIAGEADPTQHLLRHLRRHLEGIVAYADRNPTARTGARTFRDEVLVELETARARLAGPADGRRRPSARPRGRG